jgi:hypothetical protein
MSEIMSRVLAWMMLIYSCPSLSWGMLAEDQAAGIMSMSFIFVAPPSQVGIWNHRLVLRGKSGQATWFRKLSV